jgi:hypothetical protein
MNSCLAIVALVLALGTVPAEAVADHGPALTEAVARLEAPPPPPKLRETHCPEVGALAQGAERARRQMPRERSGTSRS